MTASTSRSSFAIALITLSFALILTPLLMQIPGLKITPQTPVLQQVLTILFPQILMAVGIAVILIMPPVENPVGRLLFSLPKKMKTIPFLWECLGGFLVIVCVGATVQLTAKAFGIVLPPTSDLLLMERGTPVLLLSVAVSAVLLAPLTEEILIRRFLFDGCFRFFSGGQTLDDMPAMRGLLYVLCTIFTAGLFAALHFDWVKLLPLFAFGCYLQWIRLKYDSLLPCVMVHFVNNALTVFILGMVYFLKPFWEALKSQAGS